MAIQRKVVIKRPKRIVTMVLSRRLRHQDKKESKVKLMTVMNTKLFYFQIRNHPGENKMELLNKLKNKGLTQLKITTIKINRSNPLNNLLMRS